MVLDFGHEALHIYEACGAGAGVFAVLLVVLVVLQQWGSPLNLLTRAHNALKGACGKLVIIPAHMTTCCQYVIWETLFYSLINGISVCSI